MSQGRLLVCIVKAIGNFWAWVALQIGWGGISGNHQDGVNSITQVDKDSDVAPVC